MGERKGENVVSLWFEPLRLELIRGCERSEIPSASDDPSAQMRPRASRGDRACAAPGRVPWEGCRVCPLDLAFALTPDFHRNPTLEACGEKLEMP